MVSVLVGAVILIALAVIISSFVGNFSISFTSEETEEVNIKTEEAIDCSLSNLEINDIYVNLNTNIAKVFLKNSGLNNENVLYMNLFNKTNHPAANLSSFPFVLPKGEMKAIEFNLSGVIEDCDDFSHVRVATNCITKQSSGLSVCI